MPRTMLDDTQTLPPANAGRLTLRVTAAAERRVRFGHPWLYAEAIRKARHQGRPGDLAALYDRRGRFLALGLYDPGSPIRVRILQRLRQAVIDQSWFAARLREAIQLRAPLARTGTTGYRLVHGENDGLPGLVIDRYGTTLVMKLYTAAWVPHLRAVLEALGTVWPAERLILRLARTVQAQGRGLSGLTDGLRLAGPACAGSLVFEEHGARFEVDPVHGQKTGFFLDQRDNRAQVEALAQGRSVLDAFAYTGAFSVRAARGGARQVLSVDASAPALEAAVRNMRRNRQDRAVAAAGHDTLLGDAFDVLQRLREERRRFDLVILDPPAFASTQALVPRAEAAYGRLTRLGLAVLARGGLLMASSCSSHVSAERFFAVVHDAARRSGCRLRELARTGHPVDHPVRFPEGAYLKALFAEVVATKG